MKAIIRMSLMLLVACSLQTCQDLAYDSLESDLTRANLNAAKLANNKKVFTISAIVTDENEPHNQFLAYIQGTRGTITADWGDGSSTTYQLNSELGIDLEKIYAAPGRYLITITGDLKNVTHFQSSYGQGLFDDINLTSLTGLRSLRISNLPGPEVLDVSNSRNLEDLTPTDIPNLREIRLPKQHALWAVSVSGDVNLSAASVDALINSVYQTAVKKNIWGFLHVSKYPYEEGNTEMVGPPSATSVAQLTELQNVYGWEILPEMPRPEERMGRISGEALYRLK